jgi:NAD(P)-dependent dehydrogenase (short-subunit alcohol dehydrogenase family)
MQTTSLSSGGEIQVSEIKDTLQGKVAFISGGAGAIGSATAQRLAQDGARVVIGDLPTSNLQQVAEGFQQQGLDVVAQELDIEQEVSIRAAVELIARKYGRLDILDNNAALKGLKDDRGVVGMSSDLWDRVMAVNARGTMLMCKYALPVMIAGGGGSIVNISSGTSVAGDQYATAYAVSKGAINTLTYYVAAQHGHQGIRCNGLLVGSVVTPAMQRVLPETMRDILRAHKLVGRLGQPQDIAEVVAFLASDRSSWITGQLWSIDGGFFAHIPTMPQFAQLQTVATPGK